MIGRGDGGRRASELTVRVKLWVAGLPIPLVAVKVIGKVPVAVGVPDSTPPSEGHSGGQGPGLGDGREWAYRWR